MVAALIAWMSLYSVLMPASVQADEDQVTHPACIYCGMDRTKFAHFRALATYDDETAVGTCFLHCAATDLAMKIDKTPVAIQVADYNTRQLIDAKTAHWVTGGVQLGVMTRRTKRAFASEADALAFIAAHGDNAAEFDTAVQTAFEDMVADLQMIREKRKQIRAKKAQ